MSRRTRRGRTRTRPGLIWEILAATALAGGAVLSLLLLLGSGALKGWLSGEGENPKPDTAGVRMAEEPDSPILPLKDLPPGAYQDETEEEPEWTKEEEAKYQAYLYRLWGAKTWQEIEAMGFSVIQEHSFPIEMAGIGQATLIPAMDRESRRLGLFFADEKGQILYRTDQLETNYQNHGKLEQWNEGIAAVSFVDMNEDGLLDIVLVTFCQREDSPGGQAQSQPFEPEEEASQAMHYKVGDVLFQGPEGFYRDWRLSENINRFHMNKSIRFIVSFVKENGSTEFLYTATTLEDLIRNGFQIQTDYQSWQEFEKLGRLQIVPGYFKMAEYYIFMVYLIDEEGYIVWSFAPMGEYENLYGISGIRCCDIDGDGLKDLAILGRYSYEGSGGDMVVEKAFSIYYQGTEGFSEDQEIGSWLSCREDSDMEELLNQAWAYWGWEPPEEETAKPLEKEEEEQDDTDLDRG